MLDPALLGLAFVAFIGLLIGGGFCIILVGAMVDGASRARRIGRPKVRTTIRG